MALDITMLQTNYYLFTSIIFYTMSLPMRRLATSNNSAAYTTIVIIIGLSIALFLLLRYLLLMSQRWQK